MTAVEVISCERGERVNSIFTPMIALRVSVMLTHGNPSQN
jgi:hypothetical protein